MKRFLLTTVFSLSLLAPVAGHAQGVPTVDLTAIAELRKSYEQLKLQLEEQITENLKLDEQTQQMIRQVLLLEDQLKALKDGLDLEQLLLGGDLEELFTLDFDLRGILEKAIIGDWDATTDDGFIGGKPITAIVDDLFESAGITRGEIDTLAKSDDPSQARTGAQANTGAMMQVAAEASAVEAEDSLKNLELLAKEIPNTDNLKAAIDLNTRVTIELGRGLANIWSMEAAQTIGLGQAGVMTAATLADEQKFLDLSLENNQ